jgi:L-ribulose-5-phosphate 4-epimerase
MLEQLKQEVLRLNQSLPATGLVRLTWGNVSGLDAERGLMVIKPSGVDYSELKLTDLVVLEVETGKVVEGTARPSSDSATHLELYRHFKGIGGVCHTHSPAATAWAQAARPLPCYGTTHADHFYGTVPVCRCLTAEEVAEGYEQHTGRAIVQLFQEQKIAPLAVPAVLQAYHAPFTWGTTATKAVDNSIALEMCAQMALDTLRLNADLTPLPQYLLDKHYLRKHGPSAYYGQQKQVTH